MLRGDTNPAGQPFLPPSLSAPPPQQAITAAAGATIKDGVLPETAQRALALGVLMTVWRASAQPRRLAGSTLEIVLGAVRRARWSTATP